MPRRESDAEPGRRLPRERLTTLRQSLPVIFELQRHITPTFHLPDVSAIDGDFLIRHRIECVMWDVDGTLMGYHESDVDPEFRDHIRGLFRHGPGRHAIISNCDEIRFATLGRIFAETPVLRAYRTATGPVFRSFFQGRDSMSPDEVRHLLGHHGRHVRKPSPLVIQQGLRTLGGADPTRAVMVGDQYFTDVASANLAGIRSVKVPTFRRDTFPAALRITQRLEGWYYRLRHGVPAVARP